MPPRLAFVAPLTGPVAPVGASAVAAARLAPTAPAAAVALTVVDDGCDPARGAPEVSRLVADANVIGVVGHYCSVVALAVTPLYARAGLPLTVGPVMFDANSPQRDVPIAAFAARDGRWHCLGLVAYAPH